MKEKLIEAINATIQPNDEKAITAESLANLLIEMVEAMGTGSGSGSGQVVFYTGTPNEDMAEFTLTPEQKAHNAEMVQVIKDSPIALCASFDMTELWLLEVGKENAGVDFTGVKNNFYCANTMYLPAHLAGLEGFPSAGVIAISELPAFISEDGSVTIQF